jgi:hypothetical protein
MGVSNSDKFLLYVPDELVTGQPYSRAICSTLYHHCYIRMMPPSARLKAYTDARVASVKRKVDVLKQAQKLKDERERRAISLKAKADANKLKKQRRRQQAEEEAAMESQNNHSFPLL